LEGGLMDFEPVLIMPFLHKTWGCCALIWTRTSTNDTAEDI